ncbi:MAG: putative Ig domain-containing protein [Sphingobacteriales bacterium]
MKRILLYFGVLSFLYLGITPASAQAPDISYSTPTNVYTTGSAIATLTPTNAGGAVPANVYSTVTTYAGTGTAGRANNTLATSTFTTPRWTTIASGTMYCADAGNNEIRKLLAGGVTLFAGNAAAATGSANGVGNAASFNGPYAITNDGAGNLYVADVNNNCVRKIVIATATVSTIAVGLNAPAGIVYDPVNNVLYITNSGNHDIIKMTTAGVYSVFAGTGVTGSADGTGTAASFNTPNGIAIDASGNVFVADQNNQEIREITPAGVVTTFAGSTTAGSADGTGTAATFNTPSGLDLDISGNIYVTDRGNNLIRMITPAGVVTTVAGSGAATLTNGVGTAAAFNASRGIEVDQSTGDIYISDYSNNVIRKMIGTGYNIYPTTLPTGLTFNRSTGTISGIPTATQNATTYTITGFNVAGCSSTTISIAVGRTVAWTGSSSTAWARGSNWSTGAQPGANDSVTIGVSNYIRNRQPSITAADVTVNSLTFGSAHSVTLTLAAGRTLTVQGTMTVNTGAAPVITGGSATTSIVDMAPGSLVSVVGTGVLTLNSPLNFTLQSDSTGDASVGQITSTNFTGTATTSINVERFITGGLIKYRSYRLISSPVTSGSGDYTINYLKNSIYLTGTSTSGGFDNVAAANPTLYMYRENLTTPSSSSFTGSNFRGINNITTTPLYGMDDVTYPTTNIPVGNGVLCFFRGDRSVRTFAQETVTNYIPQSATLTTSGTLNIGNVMVKAWFAPAVPTLSYTAASPVAGFNLVGNPYASAIDWDTFQGTSLATGGIYGTFINSNTMYILDPASHNYGAYSANSGGVGTNNATNIISSGQGFFVKATSTSAQLVFTESAKTSSQNTGSNLTMAKRTSLAMAKPNLANNQYFRLRLAKDLINADETMIRFNKQASTNFDATLDAIYQPGFGSVSLSGLTSDKVKFAIGTVPLPGLQQESIALNVNASTDGVYSLSLKDIVAVPQLFDVWLIDAYKKDSLNLRQTKTYSFNIYKSDSASFGSNRFSLVIRQNPAYAYRLLNFTAQKLENARQVQINWNTANEGAYTNFTVERSINGGKTFDVLGNISATGVSRYSMVDPSPVVGQNLYRLKQVDINSITTLSSVVNIEYTIINSIVGNRLSIYPNPVINNISLTIGGQTTENNLYNIKFMSSSGLVVKQVTSTQPEWQGNVNNLQPGIYIVQVLNSKTDTLVGQTKFVKL